MTRASLHLSRAGLVLPVVLAALVGCGSASKHGADDSGGGQHPNKPEKPQQPLPADWLTRSTVSLRGSLHVPASSDVMDLPTLRSQQLEFDPGASLHCEIEDDPAFKGAVKAAGGVQWGYGVAVLTDMSQPEIRSGLPRPYPSYSDGAGSSGGVEIAEADIVGISEEAALYYTPGHGLMLVDLTSAKPKLACAAQLPGSVEKFYLHQGHLVALIENWQYGAGHRAYLFHMRVDGNQLRFVETVELGNVSILDSRRFNDELVVFGSLTLDHGANGAEPAQGAETGGASRDYYEPEPPNRTLQVFHLADKLEPRMHDTLIDTREDEHYWAQHVDASTEIGAEIGRSESFDSSLYASDHYFVITQAVYKTYFDGMRTDSYQVCTKSHTVEYPYTACETQYETRPNPDYTPPESKGGDRSCNGQTLRDCLHHVAKVSNPTIQVPVGVKCHEETRSDWVCDAYETKHYTYATSHTDISTKLFIYAYTEAGFVRLADEVHDLDPSLEGTAPDAQVPNVTTSSESHELLLDGTVKALQFQNGYLYAIADQRLLTFAVDGSSLVQTSSIQGTSDELQTSLFTSDKLYLSDYDWGYTGDSSVLRVFDLSNPAFPKKASVDRRLPGGHDVILPVREGIFTMGSVNDFEGTGEQFLKLGLFSDPFTTEKSYLILGTDLEYPTASFGRDKTYYFDSEAERLFLPYAGRDFDDVQHWVSRVDVSRISDGKLITEGGVDMRETPERVRPIPQPGGAVLTFAPDSIQMLTNDGKEWNASDVFAYFRPIAEYRLDDQDHYAELLRLGNQCKLRVVPKAELNDRLATQLLPSFDCFGYSVTAYGHNLLFTRVQGVRFDDDGNVEPLSAAEVTELWAAVDARPTCVLAPGFSDEPVDYATAKPDLSKVQCYTPDELSAAIEAASAMDTAS